MRFVAWILSIALMILLVYAAPGILVALFDLNLMGIKSLCSLLIERNLLSPTSGRQLELFFRQIVGEKLLISWEIMGAFLFVFWLAKKSSRP